MGYDYFYFYPQDAEEVDYIQSYYDIHSEHEDVLGQPIYSLNWELHHKDFEVRIITAFSEPLNKNIRTNVLHIICI